MDEADIVVVGEDGAGMAAGLAERGLRVALLVGDPAAPWQTVAQAGLNGRRCRLLASARPGPGRPHPASSAFVAAAGALGLGGAVELAPGDHQPVAPRAFGRVSGMAERIILDGGRAWGVAFRGRGGEARMIRARGGVVLAGGAIATARLLLLSGIGPAAHLIACGVAVRRDAPAIGAELGEALDYPVALQLEARKRIGAVLARWPGGRAARSGAAASGTVTSGATRLLLRLVPGLDREDGAPPGATGCTAHVALLTPASRGTVRLPSNDPAAAPLVDPGFLGARGDLAAIADGVRLLYRLLAAAPFAALGARDLFPVPADDPETVERLIRARAGALGFPFGTVPPTACDGTGALRGIGGLFVADRSLATAPDADCLPRAEAIVRRFC